MFVLVFIAPFILYLLTLTNTVYGGDAGDLVSAILTRGFAHPPGYPLYTLFGIFTLHIPLPLTAAGKVTLISLVSTVIAFYLFDQLLREIFQKKYNKVFASITVLVLSVNYLIWLYAVVPEVFALNVVITLSLFLFSLKYHRTRNIKFLGVICFLIGVGATHHHTYLFMLPSVILLIFSTVKKIHLTVKTSLMLTLAFIAGLLPITYLWYAGGTYPEIIWGDTRTISGFLFVFFRQGYGTFQAGSFVTNNMFHRLLQIKNLYLFVLSDFSAAGIILFVIGLVGFVKSSISSHYKKAYILALIFYGPFFFFYANFPLRNNFEFATVERFFILFYFLLGVLLYLGFVTSYKYIVDFLGTLIQNKSLKKLASAVLIGILFLYPLSIGVKNLQSILALKNDTWAENLGRDIIQNATNHSVILLAGDTVLFDTQYVYFAKLVDANDKIIVHASKLGIDIYIRTLLHNHPSLKLDTKKVHSVNSLIQELNGRYAVFSNYKYPLSQRDYTWVPQGVLFRLVKTQDEFTDDRKNALSAFWASSKNSNLTKSLKTNPFIWKNFFITDILQQYSVAHQNSAFYYISTGDFKKAEFHIQEARSLQPGDPDIIYLDANYALKQEKCALAESRIKDALKLSQDALYFSLWKSIGKDCYKDESNISRITGEISKMKNKKTSVLD